MFLFNRQTKTDEAQYFAQDAKPLRFNSVELRDGQQSLLSTRVRTEDMLPILEKMDNVGYNAIEMWGGATFDVCVRFLHEDPWNRLREIRKRIRKTPLKMLLRGQNLLGYKPYPDDIVNRFVPKCIENGIDTIEIFDALQDIRNCETAIKAARRAGAKTVEGGLMYSLSPVHTPEVFVKVAKAYQNLGVDVLHIEDMAGLLTPQATYNLIRTLKNEVTMPIFLQCHCTGGFAQMNYWEAIKAGVDGVDACVSSLSMGTGHPAIEPMVAALRGTPRDTGLDLSLLGEISEYFREVREKYKEYETNFIGVDIGVLQHQIPGGMLSNLESQLKANGQYDKLPLVLKEAVEVRKDFGYPPLGTPSSQIVGAQASFNVFTGERYKMIPKETKQYLKGMYGRPIGEINQSLMKKALGDEKPIECKPADLIPPGYEKAKEDVGSLARSEEDILTYALFPQTAPAFLKEKYGIK